MIGRVAALVALAIGVVVVFMLLTGGGEEYEVTAEFENASQLVNGNEVVVAGARVGSVSKIELGPQGQALVTFTVGEEYAPLSRGTTATVRSPSLSQIAGRQVQLNIPPESTAGPEIESGESLSLSETVSEVDLDQLFNTLSPKTIKDLKHVIEGFEQSYDGVGEQANEGLKYLNPLLSTSRRVFAELNADQTAFENLIVDTSQFSGALAERAPDVSALIGNLNLMMNAIGDRKEQLASAVNQFPEFMRQTNTTFVNLRAALDDVDPLVDASKPAARGSATLLDRASCGLSRRGADDQGSRCDRQAPRPRQRPRRADPDPAGAGRGRDRVGLARLRPWSRERRRLEDSGR